MVLVLVPGAGACVCGGGAAAAAIGSWRYRLLKANLQSRQVSASTRNLRAIAVHATRPLQPYG